MVGKGRNMKREFERERLRGAEMKYGGSQLNSLTVEIMGVSVI